MKKYHVFFTLNDLPKPGSAEMISFVNCADAAAALGYPAVLAYPDRGLRSFNLIRWFVPFRTEPVPDKVKHFYQTTDSMEAFLLPCPWPVGKIFNNRLIVAFLAKNYYLPKHIFPQTVLLHTRDWNIVQLSVQKKIATAFHHDACFVSRSFSTEIVNSPFFRIAVTDTPANRENMIHYGMPAEKTLAVPNGVNRSFLSRRPEEAVVWRKKIMKEPARFMAVYAGALARWKGIDILVDAAAKLREVQFVIAGGTDTEVDEYEKALRQKNIMNVRFLGCLKPGDLVSLYQAADILAYPHRSGGPATHTSPLKFFEYLASGAPIVAADIAFLAEFKAKGLALEICAPDSAEAFVSCVRRALEKFPRKAEGYRENTEFARQFTWEKRMEKVFEGLV